MVFGILTFVALLLPSFYILQPIYLKINNPFFLYGFISLILIGFIFLKFYNSISLKEIVKKIDENSFIYDLEPYELVYLENQKIEKVINGTVNELIDEKIILVNDDYSIRLNSFDTNKIKLKEQRQTINVLDNFEKIFYTTLIKHLARKHVFLNISNSMDALLKYFIKSKKFGTIFYTNFTIIY